MKDLTRGPLEILAMTVIWTGIKGQDWRFIRMDNPHFHMWCAAALLEPDAVFEAAHRPVDELQVRAIFADPAHRRHRAKGNAE